ncbi:ATP-dependent RNA helicase RhlE [Mucilaginibacter lappiensis]|uniref:ATP-dependent RNA helicase RhlE n=1 Tax=Mucilaginibacter lappiensis TaxID=354630 RepID=A0ABR6PGL5_9SPHI|nr:MULTISPECIES: DEAD/DEAH box helicase [Mucilaginibacter]MBB6108902.1 ATP-dependent RNA helicase RhlE [Mucilaginibacter lappiensis]SDP81497.1 ATP-dependent RNA helicase RhlE [Mucilaginibacter sp. OK268]SIQ67158.1 ATP-dependent RNA helicase RhlE [Mucilaginibacter lappiensis]
MAVTFEEFNFNRQILNAIADAGYTEATPIQQKAIPPILNGQDVMGIAQTGTGKTAAYVLPILMKLKYAQGENPRALIISPTRELAMQIEENVKTFAANTDLRVVVLYGGLGPKTQIEQINKGVDIIVATPGRFMDIYLAGHIVTKTLQVLVLDEADKMMDMGFMPQINRILEVVPVKRQNLLFSATMSDKIHELSNNFLEYPTIIEVTPQATPAQTVNQHLYHVPNNKTKINLLKKLLDLEGDITKLIIFCKTRIAAEDVYKFLLRKYGENGVRVLHANKGQNTRINSINSFKNDEVKILVATDVASRGIDVSDVSHVINFDVPVVIEDYVHRIGRTGRALQSGEAITFCGPAEEYYLKKIEKLIKQSIPVSAIPDDVFMEETGYDERQEQNKEIDLQKRKDDPDFKGAFHEKKTLNQRKKFDATRDKARYGKVGKKNPNSKSSRKKR